MGIKKDCLGPCFGVKQHASGVGGGGQVSIWKRKPGELFFLCPLTYEISPGQGLNPRPSSDPSHRNDKAESSTLCATGELSFHCFLKNIFKCKINIVNYGL